MLTKYDLNMKKLGKFMSFITSPNPHNPIRLPLGLSW